MSKRVRFMTAFTFFLIVFLVGISVAKCSSKSLEELQIPVRDYIIGHVFNPVDEFFILGFRKVYESRTEYHLHAITWFGITYADVYVSVDGLGMRMERRFVPLGTGCYA